MQDPFRGGDNILVMADAYEPPRDIDGKHVDMKPIPTNTRAPCAEVMEKVAAEEPWFGIEQVPVLPASILALLSIIVLADSITQYPVHEAPCLAVCMQGCGSMHRLLAIH